MKNKLIYSIVVVALLSLTAYFVYASMILVTVPVVTCTETDSGIDYTNIGSIFGLINATNSTIPFNYTDTCITNVSIGEFVCGGSIDPSLSGIAGLIQEDCTLVQLNGSTNATMCFQGRCI